MNNPTLSPHWVSPHSKRWYEQISRSGNLYIYPWDSLIEPPIAENDFDYLVCQHIKGKIALDFGCGDGSYTKQYALYAEQMFGADSCQSFIQTANRAKRNNTTFLVADSKRTLPFKQAFFDIAITRKGPTSIYQQLPKYMKKDGMILGLHPGENEGKELSNWFPLLFPNQETTKPIEQHLVEIFQKGNFKKYNILHYQTTEYLQTPLDVIHYRCFGQNAKIYQSVLANLREITGIFTHFKTDKGLPITYERYITTVLV